MIDVYKGMDIQDIIMCILLDHKKSMKRYSYFKPYLQNNMYRLLYHLKFTREEIDAAFTSLVDEKQLIERKFHTFPVGTNLETGKTRFECHVELIIPEWVDETTFDHAKERDLYNAIVARIDDMDKNKLKGILGMIDVIDHAEFPKKEKQKRSKK